MNPQPTSPNPPGLRRCRSTAMKSFVPSLSSTSNTLLMKLNCLPRRRPDFVLRTALALVVVLAAASGASSIAHASEDWAQQTAKPAKTVGPATFTPAADPVVVQVAAGKASAPSFGEVPPPSVPPAAASGGTPAQPTPPTAPPAAVPSPAAPPPAVPPASPAPAAATPDAQPGPAASAIVDDHAKGKTLYSFKATDLDLKTALAMFARANNLNIIPDNDVSGTVTLDVRDLPLEEMMQALLEAGDCTWHQQGGLIRVRNTETRMFTVDYLRLQRIGTGQNSATLGSGVSGGAGGGMGGGAAGGGAGGAASVSSYGSGSSSINLTANNTVDFWKELKLELAFLLTDKGKTTLAINMTAGLIQITDRPSALKHVGEYLESLTDSVHRQVEIDVKLYDVTLNDQFQFGINWNQVIQAYGGRFQTVATGTTLIPAGNSLGSSLIQGGSANLQGMYLPNSPNFPSTQFTLDALQQQGQVEVISKPRIRTLNNQTALITVGTQIPFFSQVITYLPNAVAAPTALNQSMVTTITVGTILSITPQISSDGYVSLDISPVLTSLLGTQTSPDKTTTAPELDTKQAYSLVRVKDGTTVVLGGLIQNETATQQQQVPLLGSIPLLGKLFTSQYKAHAKKELVMFVTPTIVNN